MDSTRSPLVRPRHRPTLGLLAVLALAMGCEEERNVGGKPKAKPDPGFPTWGLVTTQYEGGTVQKFDDLPPAYRGNIDPQMPMDGRAPGSANPMSERDVADLVCFLKTLDDGYQPPATPPTSGTCVD